MLINHNKKVYLFLLFLFWLGINYLVLHAPVEVFSVPNVPAITNVSSFQSSVESPDKLVSPASLITLPDDWYQSAYKTNQIWYRAEFEVDRSLASIWAVYLPSVTHNAAVFVNGVWVGQGGEFTAPVSRNHNRPLLFDFSSALLLGGTLSGGRISVGSELTGQVKNIIEIRVQSSHPSQGLLDQFYLAPLSDLAPAYQWKRIVRVDFIQWITLSMYVMGAIIFCFWLARPQDKIYALFSLQLFIWATHNLNLFISNIPTSAHFWEAMTMSTLGWTIVAMIFFNHRYVGDRNKYIEYAALIFAVLGMGIFFLPDIGAILGLGYSVWDGFLIVFGSYSIVHLIRAFWLRQELDVYLMLLVGVPILIFGLHDILTVNNLRDRRDGLIIQYSVFPAIFLFSFFLVRRFVQSINQAEEMAENLERRVQEKQRALSEQYEQVKQMELQQVLSQERERIMRDMHDGIGGQLVSVVTMLNYDQDERSKKIKKKVQLSLTDLRLVIDSLDPVMNDLPTLLGMMRIRLAELLVSANIDLQWNVTELPELSDMSPKRSLHIMRIVQELITNCIKHSGTNLITLSTRYHKEDEPYITIEITDYGKGFDTQKIPASKSRGIKNMHYRAEQINSSFEITANKSGTVATLKLPYSV